MKRSSSPIVYGLALAVVTLIVAASISFIKINRQQQLTEIDVYNRFVKFEAEGLLDRFERLRTLNHLLASNPAITENLKQHRAGREQSVPSKDNINSLLANMAGIQHITAVFIMDSSGTCLFSSKPGFVGKNYGFRPYFTKAIKGVPAIYLAKGVTSHQVGIYFAHPVTSNQGKEIIGVAVLKIAPAFFDVTPIFSFTVLPLDQHLLRIGLVTDQGIFVDLIGNTLHAIEPLDSHRLALLKATKQFPATAIQDLSFPSGTWDELTETGFLRQQTPDGKEYYLFSRSLGTTDLSIVHIVDRKWFHQAVHVPSGFYRALLFIFALMLVIACLLIYLFDRRHRTTLEQAMELAKNEDKLRLFSKAVEQSGNSIVITDTEGSIIYVNPHFTAVTGYTLEEVYGQNPRVLKSGSQDKSVYHELWQTLLRGQTWKGVLHNRKKNGELYWEEATISPIIDSNGETTHYIAIKEDISDRVALTQQLKEEKEKLQLIVEHAGLGIAIIINRHFSWVNQAGADLFGYTSADEVVGKSSRILYPDNETFFQVGKAVYHSFARREIFKKEIRLKKKNGELFWAAITGKALDFDAPDQGIIWIVEDITPRKENEQQLQKAKKEAEEANAMKSRLLANISHDIRTPLHGILGTFSMLLAQNLKHEQDKLVRTGNRAAEFLLNLLNNLLDLSKIEAGQLVLDNYPFSIRELLGEVGEILAGQFSQKSVAYRYNVAPTIPTTLIGDALRIKQIIINLVGNSLKFTEQGSVTVSLTGEAQDNNKILLTCQVKDTGIGIPANQQERLFEAFTQADNSITRQYGGSGLGLSICRELCNLMGGRIWFESREGEGTVFYVTFLCAVGSGKELAKEGLQQEKPDMTRPSEPLTILIVDDNEANQDILRMMLEHDGHEVHIAANGLIALEKLMDSTFDLIFMDMQMPVMDGLTATRLIRECEAGTGLDAIDNGAVPRVLLDNLCQRLQNTYTPIIALTANALQDDKRRCEEAGMDNYLVKPFQREHLFYALADVAGRSVRTGKKDFQDTMASHRISQLEAIKNVIRQRYPFSEEQISTLVNTTLRAMQDDMALLSSHANDEKLDELGALAHKLKGSALNLGLEKIAEKLSDLEKAARAGDVSTSLRKVHDLHIWWYRFSRVFEEDGL
ncbi:PAS domain S-box protein [Desulfolithobacter sp.]